MRDAGEGIRSETDRIGGLAQARLLFVTRDGTQILQGWEFGKPAGTLLVLRGADVLRVPVAPVEIGMDLQGPDGEVYFHDVKGIYRLDVKSGKTELCLSLGKAEGQEIFVAAVEGKRLCLGRRFESRFWSEPVYFWVDLDAKNTGPALDGELVAGGMRPGRDGLNDYPVAMARDGTLWAIRYEDGSGGAIADINREKKADWQRKFTMRLLRINPGSERREPESVCMWVSKDISWNVWPLEDGAVMVVNHIPMEKQQNAMYFDGIEVRWHETLKDLVGQEHESLTKSIPSGTAYACEEQEVYLARIGDGFYMSDRVYRVFSGGSGLMQESGIFREGDWVEWTQKANNGDRDDKYQNLMNWPLIPDVETGCLLGVVDECKGLDWVPIAKEAQSRERVEEYRGLGQLWVWSTKTGGPRVGRRWLMTPESIKRREQMEEQKFAALKAQRESENVYRFEVEYESGDFGDFQTWDAQKKGWRKLGANVYGARVEEDLAGDTWLIRNREAEIVPREGKKQIIELDTCGFNVGRLAPESKDAVWLFTQQSALRLVRRSGEWKVEKRLSLQKQGFDVSGAWIAGRSLYYLSNGGLYRAGVDKLIEQP